MYGDIYGSNIITELGTELLALNNTVSEQEFLIEKYRLTTAMYKSYFFGKSKLAEKLQNQIRENYDSYIGEFDGMCYASWRANAIYRTLEDMVKDSLITESEYGFCNE